MVQQTEGVMGNWKIENSISVASYKHRFIFLSLTIRRVRELEEENNLVGNSLRSLEIQTDKVFTC